LPDLGSWSLQKPILIGRTARFYTEHGLGHVQRGVAAHLARFHMMPICRLSGSFSRSTVVSPSTVSMLSDEQRGSAGQMGRAVALKGMIKSWAGPRRGRHPDPDNRALTGLLRRSRIDGLTRPTQLDVSTHMSPADPRCADLGHGAETVAIFGHCHQPPDRR
jgi:hypothetical protein